ncbi:MAG TPA: hypothetical protein VM531_06900 [Sphingomicrobium sp.]|nr:hypothetical protein [Sphingomicrobium sp.]
MTELGQAGMHPSRRRHMHGPIRSDLDTRARFDLWLILGAVVFPVAWFAAHLMFGGQ